MATDSTTVPQTGTTNNDQTDLNPEVVQLAQADGAAGATGAPQTDIPGVPNGSVNVAFPDGQNIVRVQVAPGETISIPFDGDLAAKFGEEGNLAIKVGDRTIILQGYAEANQETGVTLKDESGDDIDVASVIAATDPNLDIQTAAGGAAGGSAGGSGFFSPFSNAGGLGGLGELGVLGGTELQYGLIQPDSKILIQQPEAAEIPPSIIGITPVQAINEDDLGHDEREVPELAFAKEPFGGYGPRWGNDIFDNDDLDDGGNLPDFSPEPTSVTAQVTVNPGSSPNLSLTFNAATAAALDAMHLFSENLPLHYVISDDGKTLTAFIVTGNESTVDIFTLQANDGVANPDGTITFDVTTTLLYSLDNDGKQTEGAGDSNPNTFVDDISLHIPFTVTGSSGSASGAYDIVLRDDTPDMDPFGNTEIASFDSFAPVSEGDLPTTRYGSFNFSYGADGEATEGDKFKQQDNVLEGPNATFVLNIVDPEAGEGHSYLSIDTKSIATPGDWTSSATELKSGDASVTVWAYRDGDTTIIEGRTAGDPSVDDSSTGLVFKIEINNHYGYYSAELFGPLSHPDSDQTGASDPLQFDLTATITDGDGDQKSGTQSFQLLDDGPSIEAAGALPNLTVDETNLNIDASSADLANVFSVTAGPDGQKGDLAYALGISSPGADSGLVDTATGNHVFLFMVNGQVIGKEGSDAATAETSGDIVFTLSVTSGVLTLDQQRAIIHPDSANPDEPTTLSAGDLVTLTATVTDNDNDTDSTTINIGDKLTFKDDGPAASSDTGGSIAEGSGEHVIGNAEALLLANDLPGADGYKPNSLTILGVGSLGGTLSIDGSGNLIYTPPAHVANPNGDPVTETFTYQYLDKDDDPATAQISFQVTDTGPSIDDAQVRAIVDEDALGGNPGGTKDYVGGANNSPDEAHWNGQIHFSYGNDGVGDIALSTDSDTGIRKLDGTVIQTSWDAASHTLTGYGTDLNDVVFTIHITDTATGAYTLSLLQPIRHRGTGEDEDNRNVTINVTVTDSDNSVATGSFTITIDDDTPIANNDTGGIYEEGSGAHVIGNAETVLMANDLPGADGYRAGSLAIIGSGSLGGSLVIDGSGNLIYTPPAQLNSSANVTETFTYQYTDKDGDPATAQISFQVSDGAPTVDRVQAIATVDEDPLGGNAGGDGDYTGGPNNSPDEAHWNGQIHFSYGNDGPGDIALSTAGNQTGLTKLDGTPVQTSWDAASHTLTGYGSDANDIVFTIHITDVATGAYTLTLNQPVAHGTAGTEDDLSFTVDITVTDSDNSTATGSFQVTIDDDTPVITAGGSLPSLTVDESNLAQNDSASFAGIFTALAGADGQLGNIAYALGVSAPGADSGLVDTATGNHVFLFVVNGQVVGKEGSDALDAATGSTVFTLSVDGSGNVTLDQVRAIINPVPGASHDEPATLSAANLVTLTATVTDGDHDTASATANIGTKLSFKDDGPSITADGAVPSLTVDESNLAQNDSASFAGIFTALAGADGQLGNIAYALGVSAPGADSGLVDTATNQAVLLSLEGNQVVGRAGANGPIVFTLSVDGSGNVTLDQQRAIINPIPGTSHDEPATLSAANLVTLTATITDKDNDTASATADIGTKLVFKDDGPSITADGAVPSLTVDESNLAQNDSVSFAGVFTALAGADGQQGNIAYALGVSAPGADSGLVDTATNQAVLLSLEGNQVVGRAGVNGPIVFTLSVDGSGNVTLDQQRAIINPTGGASYDEPATLSAANLVTLTATITDGDNDTKSATAEIGTKLVFKDDGLAAVGDTDTANSGSTINGNVEANDTFGADGKFGDGVVGVRLAGNDTTTPVLAGTGTSITGTFGTLILNADGSYSYQAKPNVSGVDHFVYTIKDGDGDLSTTVLDITVDKVGPATAHGSTVVDEAALDLSEDVNDLAAGTVTGSNAISSGETNTGTLGLPAGVTVVAGGQQDQLGSFGILHVNTDGTFTYTLTKNDPNHSVQGTDTITAAETFTVTIKDGLGNTNTATITIDIKDDVPSIEVAGAVPSLTVDESNLAQNDSASFAGVFTALAGADGQLGNIAYALGVSAPGADSGLVDTATGNHVFLFVVNGQVVGKEGSDALDAATGSTVFTLSVDGSGNVTLDQVRAIINPVPGASHDEPATLSAANLVTLTATVTDGDHDTTSATANIGTKLSFKDDGLAASSDLGGTLETTGTVSKDAANGVLANDQFGADGAKPGGGVVGAAVGDTGTASTGNINGPLVGNFGTLTLNSDGSYSYTAKANVSGTDVFTYTIQDGDGDTATATLNFTVQDQAKGSLSGSGGAYEDGAPGQYQGDFDFNPAGGNPAPSLNLNFTGADNETVTSYTFNDVPAGVKLYDVSVPGSPVLLFTGDGSADFVASGALLAKIQAHQIVVVGPANSDADITLNVTAAITDPTSGLNGSVSTNVIVYVDAVADQPTNLQIIVADSSDSGSSFSLNEVGTLQVKANFADLDGSETHSVTVQLQSGFTASGFTGADLTAPGGTFNGVPYTYNVATGTVVFTVPNSVSDLDLTFHVKAPTSGTLPDALNFTATATATETTVSGGLGGGNVDLSENNASTVTAQTGIPATRILDGSIITNTSSGSQEMILSFIDTASSLDAFAQVFVRDAGGQQGAFLTDAGFNIDRTHDFSVVAENAVDGHAVLITDMTVEGVTVVGQGTVQLDHDASSNKPVAITDVISPDTGADQAGGYINSTDGKGSITDADATHHNYLYGGDNADTITAGTGSDGDILNGGKSADTLTGGTGNDLLVYGVGDHIDGKEGFDILRVDQGALYNTGKFQGGWSVEPDIKDATVDLRGADIKNIESILITEEAKPDSDLGTTLKLTAQDVLHFTDEHHSLYIVGSQGDKLDFDEQNWTNTGQIVTSDGGQQFVHYQATINAVTVNLYVDKDVQTQ